MILIHRGKPDTGEALSLAAAEVSELARVRAIIAQHQRQPTSDELGTRYRCAAELLWRRQHRKCAYCECVEQQRRNDVEHYRPKARAVRAPGSAATHGYWWLAWCWDNLLFSCRNCNQALAGGRGKLDNFPLEVGSKVHVAEEDPRALVGHERPLLIDPSVESGVEHIEFERVSLQGGFQWRPRARSGSPRGEATIRVCGLDRDDLVELYTHHVDEDVRDALHEFESLPQPAATERVHAAWRRVEQRLYRPGARFVGLSYDALRVLVPDDELAAHGISRCRPQ